MSISVIGQGWVGKNLSDNLEARGYEVIRYSLEEPYMDNKDKVRESMITFVCVPTPTNTDGFFYQIVDSVIPLCGKVVVIRSTLKPTTTDFLQEKHKDKIIMHAPEFLREASAREDTERPQRNIIGITNPDHAEMAKKVLDILPKAPFEKITTAKNAELVKYAGNAFLTMKVLFANLVYDICQVKDIDYGTVKQCISADERIGSSHLNPMHGGRGASGDCLLKDFEGFKQLYEETGNTGGFYALQSLIRYNIGLLSGTDKDFKNLSAVYGKVIPNEEHDKKPKLRVKSNNRSPFHGKPRKVKDKKGRKGA